MRSFLVREEIMLLALYNFHLCSEEHNDFHSTKIVSISLVIQNHLTQLICYYVTKNTNKITILMAARDCIAYILFLAFIVVYSLKKGGMRRKYTHTQAHTSDTCKEIGCLKIMCLSANKQC